MGVGKWGGGGGGIDSLLSTWSTKTLGPLHFLNLPINFFGEHREQHPNQN